ncbi:MAG: cytochrome C peroxidase [Acidobacteria bacterium]|nr:cytochrome C peroxidase [Acidobacteriota bacterium]
MFKLSAIVIVALTLQAQPSLRSVPVPQATNLNQYVRDQRALTILGKALFWDMQVGSDGVTACATCHFHAGADHRSQHQLANTSALNVSLTSADFPFHSLSDPTNNNSRVLRDNSAIYGSAGVFRRKFTAINLSNGSDDGFDLTDLASFALNGLNLRQVTTRNAPSVINAVFNARNFWDGRARNAIDSSSPLATIQVVRNGQLTSEPVNSTNASLILQAIGPPTNTVEMSYDGLSWLHLGQRLLASRPLARQRVASDDSVLGDLANPNGNGLRESVSYGSLIQAAFAPQYWQSTDMADGFSQAEHNFKFFFGLALDRYQAMLVSDDSPFDRFAAGEQTAMTPQQIAGLNLFRGRAECNTCHTGPEFTLASVGALINNGPGRGPGAPPNAGTDTGFFRTGVSPISADAGLGGFDDLGRPLARNANAPGTNGAFKTPGLRNIEFTGPYFHNGGQATLEQVVEFYNRGGDFPAGGLGPDIRRLNLNANDRAALVAFMKALSDDRVKFQRAPFDHPELCVPNGHTATPQTSFNASAEDKWALIPATGRSGVEIPLQTFAEMLDGTGNDGTRAHTLTQACPVTPAN